MPIELPQPITQPAIIYSASWVTSQGTTSDPNGLTSGGYTLSPYAISSDGTKLLSSQQTARFMPDLFALAAHRYGLGKPTLAQWLQLGQDLIAELEVEAATGSDPFNVPLPPPEDVPLELPADTLPGGAGDNP